jgi:hypothetical protein
VGVVAISGNAAHVEKSLRVVLAASERMLGRDLVDHEIEVI